MTEQRYDRQKLIEGWDQSKLEQGVVSIIGSGKLAQYIALPLVALGVGQVRIIDTAPGDDDMLLDIPLIGELKTDALERALTQINPSSQVFSIGSYIHSPASLYFLEGSHVVVDATNDYVSKEHALLYARSNNISCISAGANLYRGKAVTMHTPDIRASLLPMFAGAVQGDLVSLALGGVVAEEVKKVLMGDKELFPHHYDYNLGASERFTYRTERKFAETSGAFSDKKILMVGAGALGCFLGPATMFNIHPARLDIMDFDSVEEHNLNRQVCHYNAVGKLKAESLAEVLRKMSQKTEIHSIVDKFTEQFESKEQPYDIIFDAVDSFYAKALVHTFAVTHAIPLVSGGTDFRAATALAYAPGRTSCLNCQINLNQLALRAEIIRRTSCTQAPNPSVIMTNQIAGAFMVAEARCILRPDIYGEPVNGDIRYISDFDARGGITRKDGVCACHTRPAEKVVLPDPARVKVEEKNVNGKIVKEVYLDGQKI